MHPPPSSLVWLSPSGRFQQTAAAQAALCAVLCHTRWMVQHKMVDVIVTTAGGIEEDFIKCMGHTYIGDFSLKGEGHSSSGPQGGGRSRGRH